MIDSAQQAVLDFGAMLWKELLQISHSRGFAAWKTVLAAVLAGSFAVAAYFAIYSWPDETPYETMPFFGRVFLLATTGIMAFALSMAAMNYASAIIVSEAVNRRLPFLLVTRLGSGAIIVSKAAAVCARVLAVVVTSLPFLAILNCFGGSDWRMVAAAAAFIGTNVWLYTSVGLFASVVSRTARAAQSVALSAALLWCILPPFVYVILESLWKSMGPSLYWLLLLNPFFVFATFAGGSLSAAGLAYHVAVNLALSAVFTGVAVGLFRPLALRNLSAGAKDRRPRFLPWSKRQRAVREAPAILTRWFDVGIIRKELASWRTGRAILPLVAFACVWGWVIGVSAVENDWTMLTRSQERYMMFVVEASFFLLLLAFNASSRIAGEKEARTFQLLALTSLGARRILAGKAFAAIVEQAPAILFLFAHLAVLSALGAPPVPAAVWTGIGLAVSTVFAASLGTYASLTSKKIQDAVGVSLFLCFAGGYMAILPVIGLWTVLRGGGVQGGILPALIVVPIAAAVLALTFGRLRRRGMGNALAVVSYGLLVASLTAVATIPRADYVSQDSFVTFWATVGGSLMPWTFKINGIHAALVGLAVQIGLLAWMAAASVAGFEGQVRRSA